MYKGPTDENVHKMSRNELNAWAKGTQFGSPRRDLIEHELQRRDAKRATRLAIAGLVVSVVSVLVALVVGLRMLDII